MCAGDMNKNYCSIIVYTGNIQKTKTKKKEKGKKKKEKKGNTLRNMIHIGSYTICKVQKFKK